MESIFHRVSIRKYLNKPVEEEKLLQILKAGMQAPSAGNQQPWEFYVVTDKQKLKALAQVHTYSDCVADAPAAIVPVYRKQGLIFPMYAQIDLAIAQQNIWLETDHLGLGGVWLGIAPQTERMDDVRKVLDLPKDVEAFSIFALGYPAESRAQQDRFDESRIHFVK